MNFLIQQSVWLSILVFVTGVFVSIFKEDRFSHYLFALGWLFLGIYWLTLPTGFLEKTDYFNAVLVLLSAFFAFTMFFIEVKYYKKFSEELDYIGKAAALGLLFFFPYNYLTNSLNIVYIQEIVAQHTFFILELIKQPVEIDSNLIYFYGKNLNIIKIDYACTGLGSMALFFGAITPTSDEAMKKIKALIVALGSIYFLNLLRNVFVIYATGNQVFEGINILGMTGSFHLAHNFFSKTGAVIALVSIAYYVLIKLPDLEKKIFKLIEFPTRIFKEISEG